MSESKIYRRTFEAENHEFGSEQRMALNRDVLTSEYYHGQPWLVRTPAFMSDGTPNPVQKFHDRTFKTKREAQEIVAARTEAK